MEPDNLVHVVLRFFEKAARAELIMPIENTVFYISLGAMIYPIIRLVLSLVREVRATKLVVTDHDGKVMAEFSTERVQQTDLKDLERLHERVKRDKGAELRAA